MKLVVQKKSKHDKYDGLCYLRNDGVACNTSMPRQGLLPHDLVHYVVESLLPFPHGFLSVVARGAEVGFTMAAFHDKARPDVEIQSMQVEAVVEALQTQMWAGSFDEAAFLYACDMACLARDVPPYSFGEFAVATLYAKLLELGALWQALPFSTDLTLEFQAAL